MRKDKQAGEWWIGAMAISFVAVLGAKAGQVYDNGSPVMKNGNEMTQWIQAEDFSLDSPVVLTNVRFWGFEQTTGAYVGSIVWSIYSDSSSTPGTLLQRGTAVPTVTDYGTDYQFDFAVGTLNLGAGTYWLGLHNGPLTTTTRETFYWNHTAANATTPGHEDQAPFDTGGWFNNSQEHAFELFAQTGNRVIPAPGAILLGMFGTSMVGWMRRRRTL